jgi:hypothetical protein
MIDDPDRKVGDDYPEHRRDDGAQPFPFIPPGVDKTLKRVFRLEEEDEEEGAPPNPHHQEPNNKPS